MKNNFLQNNTGYTIIETMIAVSLFLIIAVTAMGAFLNANVLHQKSQDVRSIMDNMTFMMEDMSRNLRTGYNYHCFLSGDTMPTTTSNLVSVPKSSTNASNCWGISFEPETGVPSNDGIDNASDNDQWVYYIGPDTNLPGNPLAVWKSTVGPYAAAGFVKLTPDEVVIQSVSSFAVLGAESYSSGNRQQPFVTIRLVGKILLKNGETPFNLQTSVSQRLIDVN
ncbi:MAG: type II secretion system protein [Patescibacteria group bacterium]